MRQWTFVRRDGAEGAQQTGSGGDDSTGYTCKHAQVWQERPAGRLSVVKHGGVGTLGKHGRLIWKQIW